MDDPQTPASGLLEEYEFQVSQEWHPADIEEIFSMVVTRDTLSERAHEATSEQVKALRIADQRWQNQFMGTNAGKLKPDWKRTEPKNEWWWLDQLDTLTEEERSTL